jgi:KRAB domain-containing zinc finger protein
MLSHTGDKPYECNYKTDRKSSLALHMNTYTGKKPFECDECNYNVTRKSNLVQHILMQETSHMSVTITKLL